jgi:hypothetical protein
MGYFDNHDSDGGDDNVHGMHSEWEKHERHRIDHTMLGRQGGSEDHGTDNFCGYGLENIGTRPNTIPNHISYKISNDSRISIIVKDM